MLLNNINLKDESGNNLTSFDTPGEFLEKILKPCINSDLEKFEAASGYFSTASFISLGNNLDSFFNKKAKLRIVIGTEDPDKDILDATISQDLSEEIMEKYKTKLYQEASLIEDEISRAKLSVISFLILEGLLEIKVALKTDESSPGIFHPKTYIFTDVEKNILAATGSGNFTKGSFEANYEDMSIYTNFDFGEEYLLETSDRSKQNSFSKLWENDKEGLEVVVLDKKFAEKLLENLGNPNKEWVLAELAKIKNVENLKLKNEFYKLLIESPIYSEFNLSKSALHPHQINSLKIPFSNWPIRTLFADEVGLGKTLEMGALIAYMYKQKLIKSVVVLAPAQLMTQLQEEFLEHFNLPFWYLDSKKKKWKLLDDLNQNPATYTEKHQTTPIKYDGSFPPLAIMSKTLASKRGNHIFKNFEENGLPDLLVVDEAHWARKYKQDDGTFHTTLLRDMISEVKDNLKHMIFATATPMRKQPDEYYYLLELLGIGKLLTKDEYFDSFEIIHKGNNSELNDLNKIKTYFERITEVKKEDPLILNNNFYSSIRDGASDEWLFENKMNLLKELVITHPSKLITSRNIQENLKKYPETYKIPDRKLISSPIKEEDIGNGLGEFFESIMDYVYNHYQKTELAITPGKKINTALRQSQIKERFASSFWSAKKSLETRKSHIEAILHEHQNIIQLNNLINNPLGSNYSEDELDDNEILIENSTPLNYKNITSAASSEIRAIDERLQIAEKLINECEENRNVDPKINYVIKLLDAHFIQGNEKPVLIFSKYTDTLEEVEEAVVEYLCKGKDQPQLGYANYTGSKQNVYRVGFTSPVSATKKEVTSALKSEKIKIVFCSNAANEGLNLQTASVMINVDVPWIPSDLEQRIGRIARLGQREKVVQIYNLWYPNSIESYMYSVLLDREAKMLKYVGPYPDLISESISSKRAINNDSEASSKKLLENINRMRKDKNMSSLSKLWSVDDLERKPVGNIFREGIKELLANLGLDTEGIETSAGEDNVLSFHHSDFALIFRDNYEANSQTNAELYGLMFQEKLWGFIYKLNDKKNISYLINPMDLPRLLNSVFAEKAFNDEQKCIYIKNSLSSLLNSYIEQDYKVLIPAHYRTQFTNTIQMPYDYKQEAEEVFIGSFSVN
jgi:SNF2 family DNA or RNA helicase